MSFIVHNLYSMYPPFFLITAFRRSGTAHTAVRSISCGIFAHSLVRDCFRDSILLWDFEQALDSKMDHTEKSRGLRSGLELIGHYIAILFSYMFSCKFQV